MISTRAWTATVMFLLILAAYGKPEDVDQARDQFMLRLTITPWLLLLSAPVVVALLFIGFASGPAVRSAFTTADVHAALPALLTGILVWEFSAVGPATGGLPAGPPAVRFAALIGGPASVTAVAWWEIHRLRTRHGVALRS